jgi:hypothetical protein
VPITRTAHRDRAPLPGWISLRYNAEPIAYRRWLRRRIREVRALTKECVEDLILSSGNAGDDKSIRNINVRWRILEQAGLDALEYNPLWGLYRLRLSANDVKNKTDVLRELMRLAY